MINLVYQVSVEYMQMEKYIDEVMIILMLSILPLLPSFSHGDRRNVPLKTQTVRVIISLEIRISR